MSTRACKSVINKDLLGCHVCWSILLFFLNNFKYVCIYLAVLRVCCGTGFSLVAVSGGYSSCGAQASHCRGFSRCRAWAPGMWAAGVAAPGI